MTDLLQEHLAFYRQFRTRFETTGAIAPSSRFLAKAVTRPLAHRQQPARILEVGPGTGVVTRQIVKLMRPGDRLDLVELNEDFGKLLNRRFQVDPLFRPVAEQSRLHVCALQEFAAEGQYDFIVSGLPLNNFPVDLVKEVFEIYFRLLAPRGVLSYFEYMAIRTFKKLVAGRPERDRLRAVERLAASYLTQHRFRRDWVFVNFPPAWVQHLQMLDGAPGQN